MITTGAIPGLITLVMWLIIAVIVYYHAESNGYEPLFWSAVTVIFGVFGLLAYGIRILA